MSDDKFTTGINYIHAYYASMALLPPVMSMLTASDHAPPQQLALDNTDHASPRQSPSGALAFHCTPPPSANMTTGPTLLPQPPLATS